MACKVSRQPVRFQPPVQFARGCGIDMAIAQKGLEAHNQFASLVLWGHYCCSLACLRANNMSEHPAHASFNHSANAGGRKKTRRTEIRRAENWDAEENRTPVGSQDPITKVLASSL